MTATYDVNLATDKDWVRFKIGDSVVDPETRAKLQDEEIEAVLAEESNKWLAAARLAESILAKRQGATSKSVGDLSISYGDGSDSSYRGLIKDLREEGCRRLLKTSGSSVMRIL